MLDSSANSAVITILIHDPDRPDVGDLEGVHVALGYAVRLDVRRTPGPLDLYRFDAVQEAAAPVAQVVLDNGPVVVFHRHFQEFFRLSGRQVLHVRRLLEVRRVPVGPAGSLVQLVTGQAVSETKYRFLIGRSGCRLRRSRTGRVVLLARFCSSDVSFAGTGTVARIL